MEKGLFSKTTRIIATFMCIASIVASLMVFPSTSVYAAEIIPGNDADSAPAVVASSVGDNGDASVISDIPGTDIETDDASVFYLAHEKGSIKVGTAALEQATADTKIKLNKKKLSKKGFIVNAKIDGEKTAIAYLPVKAFVKKLGGTYKKSGSKVTVVFEDGSLRTELSFKVGKDNYSLICTDRDNDVSAAAAKLSFGKSCLIDNTVYAPYEAIASLVENLIWSGLMDIEYKKNTLIIENHTSPRYEQFVTGGWGSVSSPVVTAELKAVFDKALEHYTGVKLTPVAYIAVQVVAGLNHRFICRKKPVVAPSLDAAETFAFVEIYEDLSGNAEITSVTDTGVETKINDLMGGWRQFDYDSVDMSQLMVADNLLGQLSEGKYKAVTILSQQVVAGLNLCLLCTRTTETGATGYSIVYAYVTPGMTSAEITDSIDL